MPSYDVVIVGGGNAGYCAAHAATEAGADRVLLVEKAPREEAGGNSYFTVGAFRAPIEGLDWLRQYVVNHDDPRMEVADLAPYTPDDFRRDMERVTDGNCDPGLTEVLVTEAGDTIPWLHAKGMPWKLMFDRQSYERDGRYVFVGEMPLGVEGGGAALVAAHDAHARATGIEVRHATPVVGLIEEQGRIRGVRVGTDTGHQEIRAAAVVLTAGGFQADARRRAAYLGKNWDLARVRGTRHNTGEVLDMAIGVGARTVGNWSCAHAVPWDPMGGRHGGNRELTSRLTRRSYQFGISVNRDAQRFLDEGEGLRNYTYAKVGVEVLQQPGAMAYQIFDAQVDHLILKDEYGMPGASRVEAGSVEELADGLGLDRERLVATIESFNAAVRPGDFDPTLLDGKGTVGIHPPKSNWALPIDSPPFVAYPVTCGVTFTFGGLQADTSGRVLGSDAQPIAGLYVAGEMLGGLFFGNYPSGSGLPAGAVFGRRAGRSAVLDRT